MIIFSLLKFYNICMNKNIIYFAIIKILRIEHIIIIMKIIHNNEIDYHFEKK